MKILLKKLYYDEANKNHIIYLDVTRESKNIFPL